MLSLLIPVETGYGQTDRDATDPGMVFTADYSHRHQGLYSQRYSGILYALRSQGSASHMLQVAFCHIPIWECHIPIVAFSFQIPETRGLISICISYILCLWVSFTVKVDPQDMKQVGESWKEESTEMTNIWEPEFMSIQLLSKKAFFIQRWKK